MTWLSRLLPQSRSLQRLADYNHLHRAQQGRRRRRTANLEKLEPRTLLSNVTATVAGSVLTITGDTHNDAFSVTENNATGQITLVGVPATSPTNPHLPLNTTTINGLNPPGFPYTTTEAITSIEMTLPGDFNNTDFVTITSTGAGKGTLASVTIVAPGVTGGAEGLDLNLTVTSLTLTGELSLYDAPTAWAASPNNAFPPLPSPAPSAPQAPNAPPGYVFPTVPNTNTAATANPTVPSNNLGGVLVASVNHSTLGSLYIEQDGCCTATVTVDHDTISGSAIVEEGVANGDTITLTNSTAGATTLIQGYGPTMAGCNGSGNLITVQDDPVPPATGPPATVVAATTGLFDLAITQLGPGSGAKNAAGQTILVGTVSPVEVALTGFGITATQNDGSGVNTGGGTATPNVIHIESITVYGHLTNSFGPSGPPSIVTSQGDGSGDSTTIDSSVVFGNISASQGNGGSDIITLAADTAGFALGTTGLPPVAGTIPGSIAPVQPVALVGYYGLVTLSQGNGGSDTILLTSAGSEFDALNVFNNLVITQGNGGGDTITVDSTVVVTGDIIAVQGNGAGDAANILATTAGYATAFGPILMDHGGNLVVIQGNGYEDMITITSHGLEFATLGDFGSIFNNVVLIQGSSTPVPVDCTEPTGDIIIIDETIINSNLLIFQNAMLSGPMVDLTTQGGLDALAANPAELSSEIITDGPGLGNNVVDIGTGLSAGAANPDGSGVFVGEETFIWQGGANNTVVLGGQGLGPGLDFQTGFLDIFTGSGGGGTVFVTNSTDENGSFFGNPFEISAGPLSTGNTLIDDGGNFGPFVPGPGYV